MPLLTFQCWLWFLRFSHSPLIDEEEEEEAKEPMLNEAFGKKNMADALHNHHHVSDIYLQPSPNYCFSFRGDEDEGLKA